MVCRCRHGQALPGSAFAAQACHCRLPPLKWPPSQSATSAKGHMDHPGRIKLQHPATQLHTT